MKSSDHKWTIYKSSTVYDFETSRAIILKIFYSYNDIYQEDIDRYLAAQNKRFGDGYCWVDEELIEY